MNKLLLLLSFIMILFFCTLMGEVIINFYPEMVSDTGYVKF
jgi:hypothetical protein